ncbi:tyrosine-type recombinase/integrase, partial [Skermanella aerolata]
PVILKRLGTEAGLDPEAVAGLSGHSTRVGAAQDLRRSGASVLDLQAEGGWRDPRMPGRYTARIDAAHGAMARLARIQEGEDDGQGDT